MIAVFVRLAGLGPFGRVPPASCSIAAIWAGLGVGKPSGRGYSNGAAATLVAATVRVSSVWGEVKRMVRKSSSNSEMVFVTWTQLLETGRSGTESERSGHLKAEKE